MQDCRMYENKFPEVDSVVMVQVTSIAEMGAYVQLLEYNNTEGNSHSSHPSAQYLVRSRTPLGIVP